MLDTRTGVSLRYKRRKETETPPFLLPLTLTVLVLILMYAIGQVIWYEVKGWFDA